MWCNGSIRHLGCWGAVRVGHFRLKVYIWVGRIVASAADCKSADFGHRWFESNPAHLPTDKA